MFGNLIKEYRKTVKMSQEDMAYKLGISSNHLSRIERYKTYPSGDLISRIISIVSENIEQFGATCHNSNLYGILLMIKFDNLKEADRTIIYNETIRLIDLTQQIHGSE